ncbi:MAG: DEAD/DEAH box helicase family protein [Dehalococcoidales bacterium]|nr:DEAD/DEAH box helicase family protein [Dehalococcoidales bacterium]MDP6737421.1 DEAD/DEAH box helicase family protein [Dehalococcoidales bacterium]
MDSGAAKPLLAPYAKGEGQRRYYQDAAIRAVLEKVASGQNRALLSLATGSGKTFIAVNPNRKEEVDTRTTEELLDIIEQKGSEIQEALAMLRSL